MRVFTTIQPKEATHIPEPPIARFLFADTRMAWFWLLVRLYVGYQWLTAGLDKLTGHSFTLDAAFLQLVVLPNAAVFAYLVTFGEVLIGLGLLLGVLTGIAAFFGVFMNLNFLLSGAVSINPIIGTLALFLVLAWRVAGYYGVDRYLLPLLGTPWTGTLARQKRATEPAPAVS